MKRIILKTPKTSIPMSRDELKSIVGGVETYLCQCTLLDNTSSQLEHFNILELNQEQLIRKIAIHIVKDNVRITRGVQAIM